MYSPSGSFTTEVIQALLSTSIVAQPDPQPTRVRRIAVVLFEQLPRFFPLIIFVFFPARFSWTKKQCEILTDRATSLF